MGSLWSAPQNGPRVVILVPEFRHFKDTVGKFFNSAWYGHLRHSEIALRSEMLSPNVEFMKWRKMRLRTTAMSQGLSLPQVAAQLPKKCLPSMPT